ncbi:DnaB-like helicase N-terminal domain-containing protein [Corynebacterium striatum]|uniref:DnaB-like helicase N-terminal domain-containing protein n=1 Tax=Corynebacterium striatum TaxID=43770 RepID=UPI003B5C995F
MTLPTKENTRPVVESEQVQQANGTFTSTDDTSALYAPATEIALLSGLLAARAGQVLEVAQRLEGRDFYAPQNATIYAAVTAAARRLDHDGQPTAPLQPELVQRDLQAAGELTDTVATALIQATSAKHLPPVIQDVHRLAEALRRARLHRALDTAGHDLVEAANRGSDDDLRRCIGNLAFIPEMARRAGLEVA